MKPKFVCYESARCSDKILDVDTGHLDGVDFSCDLIVQLDEENVKELVLQLTTWLGYKAMENG